MDRIAQLKNFLEKEPNDAFLQYALALEYIKMNNDTEAQILFEKLLTEHPSYIASYYHLGQLYQRNKKIQQAQQCYQQGMQVAHQLGDKHTYNELKIAYDDL